MLGLNPPNLLAFSLHFSLCYRDICAVLIKKDIPDDVRQTNTTDSGYYILKFGVFKVKWYGSISSYLPPGFYLHTPPKQLASL